MTHCFAISDCYGRDTRPIEKEIEMQYRKRVLDIAFLSLFLQCFVFHSRKKDEPGGFILEIEACFCSVLPIKYARGDSKLALAK